MFNELREVLEYIVRKLDENKISQKYNQLADLYEKARTEPSEELTTAIEQLKEDIKNSQSEVNPSSFDEISLRIYKRFDKDGLLGGNAHDRVLLRLSELGINPAGASAYLHEYANQIQVLEDRAKSVVENLQSLFDEPTQLEEGQERMQVVFDGQSDVVTLPNLSNQSQRWEKILDIAKQVFPDGQPDSQIIKIYKSSPTVIVIDGPESIIFALASAAYFALQVKGKMLSNKKLELDIEKAELEKQDREDMVKILQKNEEFKLNKAITEATEAVLKKQGDKISSGHMNIAKNAIDKLVRHIYNFLVEDGVVSLMKGGRVDDPDLLSLGSKTVELKREQIELSLGNLLKAKIEKDTVHLKTENKPSKPKRGRGRPRKT